MTTWDLKKAAIPAAFATAMFAFIAVPSAALPASAAPMSLTPAASICAQLGSVSGFTASSRSPRKPIYLTFDDGPSPTQSRKLMTILKRNGVTATFFVLGNAAHGYPGVVRAEKAAGHAIGNHTWDHRELTHLSSAGIRSELIRGSRAIKAAIGAEPRCMRPPYGSTNGQVRAVNRSLHLRQILWAVDTNDWQLPSVNTLTKRILSARPGQIVLMHDGGGNRSRTLAAVARAIPKMIKRGDRFATVAACR